MRLTRLRLIVARRSLRRMRFFACGVFAIFEVPLNAQEKRARSRGRTRSAPPLREAVGKGNPAALAAGTEKGRAARVVSPANHRAAAATFPFAPIDSPLLREIA